jgi:hypothetical protein
MDHLITKSAFMWKHSILVLSGEYYIHYLSNINIKHNAINFSSGRGSPNVRYMYVLVMGYKNNNYCIPLADQRLTRATILYYLG